MANDVTLQSAVAATPAANTVIATDDAGSRHYQLVKLVNATEDSVTRTGVSADPIYVALAVATAAVTSVSDSATSVTLLGASATRKGFRIFNNSPYALYAKYGTTASLTDFTVLVQSYGFFSEDNYSGRVDGIWGANGSGAALVTELS